MGDQEKQPGMRWADFLASAPPDTTVEIVDLFRLRTDTNTRRWISETPDVLLYCDSEACQGARFFRCTQGTIYLEGDRWEFGFIHYSCRNCQRKAKIFAVAVKQTNNASGLAMKLGEMPPFGPHTPARVITLIGPDKDLFLKGRKCENRGLGIGAFSYYRRVVEKQSGRIIAEIARVAERIGAKKEVVAQIRAAANETQFSKAIDEIKQGFPDVLLIKGVHNPLTLLHKALSEGLHNHTDEECLKIAQEIRVVLTELAERISQALKEEAELDLAVTR